MNRLTKTIIHAGLALAILALPALGAAAVEGPALELVDRAMAADYDEAGAQALQAEAAKYDAAIQALVKGITWHNLSWNGMESYTQPAIDILASVKADPLGEMYWGSAITLIAQYAIKRKDVGIAAAKSQEGLAIIASAMKRQPGSVELHFLRLLNGIEISRQSPFKQYDLIKEDVDFLLAALAKPNKYDKAFKAAIWLSIGDWWFDTKKVTKALSYYEKAMREAPGSRIAAKAKQRLAELEG
jgi:tetratricopeptide (TPR) repeat protein